MALHLFEKQTTEIEGTSYGLEFPLEDGYLFVLNEGLELIEREPEIIDELINFPKRPWNMTRYLASGNNGPLLFLNEEERFIVKQDSSKNDIRNRLERTAILSQIVNSPNNKHEWIKVTRHYGGIQNYSEKPNFLLLDYVPRSASLDLILQYDGLGPVRQHKIREALGQEVDYTLINKIYNLYYQSISILSEQICLEGMDPDEFLVDLHPGNFLAQKNEESLLGYNFWIIDL